MPAKKRNILICIAALIVIAIIVWLVSGSLNKGTETPAETATPEITEALTEEPAETPTVASAEEASAETPAEESAEVTAEAAAEPVLLVTVNGEAISSDNADLQNVISYYMDYAANYGYDTTSPEMVETINQYSLQYVIRSVLIRQKAAELGLDQVTDEEKAEIEASLKEEWEGIVEDFITQYGSLTETSTDDEKAAARADAEAKLLEMGYDEARFISEYSEADIENKITEKLSDYLTDGKTVTEEDVQNYFNDLVREDQETYENQIDYYEYMTQYYGQSSYYVPEGYRAVTHILLEVNEELLETWKDLSARLEEQKSAEDEEPTDDAVETESVEEVAAEETPSADTSAEETPAPEAEPTEEPTPTPEPVTQEMVDAAEKAILDSVQPVVDEINAKLESGASFDDLIKEYGTDPGMQDDATRAEGYAVHKDSILWDPIFTNAAMGLEKIGDVSKPVVSQFGVHILQYLKDIPAGAVELTDEMKNDFRTTLLSEMRNEALNSALDQWTAEAEIVYTEDGESWKMPEDEDEPAEEAAEEPAAEEPAEEQPAAEETVNP